MMILKFLVMAIAALVDAIFQMEPRQHRSPRRGGDMRIGRLGPGGPIV